MRIFISGGCKNGKSLHAQKLTRDMGAPLYYLATMLAKDSEDEERVKLHREAREGWGFQTVEAPYDILAAVEDCSLHGAFLLDSVTALLENRMFTANSVNPDAYKDVARELCDVVFKLPNIVVVSDYIYSDAFIYDELVERYREGLAYIDREMAAICEVVLEACCGELIVHKGEDALRGGRL